MSDHNCPSCTADFHAFLDEIGVTQAQMDAARAVSLPPVEIADDLAHQVQPSSIEGLGVFSGASYKAGDRVCTLRLGAGWTVCGRYINHSPRPNAMAIMDGNGAIAIATRDICEGDEITLDYRQVKAALS